MKFSRMILAVLAAVLLVPSLAQARDVKALRLGEALRALGGGYTVPPAWAGLWEDQDSVFTGCTVETFQSTSTDQGVLCSGDLLEPDTTKVVYSCEGTVTDTSVDITCTGSFDTEGCIATFSIRTVGTRSGNTSYTVSTVRVSYAPPESCFGIPDQCTRIVTHSTRLGPAPAEDCGTPVENTTWGSIKARHR